MQINTERDFQKHSFLIGLGLAVFSSLFIGISFIIKKIALKQLSASGNTRASAGGFAYLKQWFWWLGLLSMGVGEGANLLAYGFAPAALVTPLGALSVLVTTILSSRFLNENLNIIGKNGCFLCVVGSIIIVLHSPKTEEIQSFSILVHKLSDTLFVCYVFLIAFMSFMTKYLLVPKFGNTNIIIYLFMCSGMGSLTVVFCKAVALGFKDSYSNNVNNFSNPIFWLLIGLSIGCIMIQMNYLNKSLDVFNTSVVTPVYYVMFTILAIVASGILFREWEHMTYSDMLGCLCGFLVVIVAIFMLNLFKDIQISFQDINYVVKQRSTDLMLKDNLDSLWNLRQS